MYGFGILQNYNGIVRLSVESLESVVFVMLNLFQHLILGDKDPETSSG